MAALIQLIVLLLELGLIAYAISTWFLSPYHPFRAALANLFEPILAPIRRLIPPLGGFDFSIFFLFILIGVLQNILVRVLP
jgi:YggT family protein